MDSRINRCARAGALLGVFSLASAASGAVTLNEIRIDQDGPDTDEYVELAGTPGEPLNGLFHLVVGDGTGTGIGGAVEVLVNFTGFSIPADGYFLAAEAGIFTLGTPDVPLNLSGTSQTLNFENSDNLTHLLVRDLNPAIHTGDGFGGGASDLDQDDDGVIDASGDWDGDGIDDGPPWQELVDSVVFNENVPLEDLVYGATMVGPDGPFVPGHAYRFPDATGDWQIGAFTLGTHDTPGEANVPEPSALALIALGALLAPRPRRRRAAARAAAAARSGSREIFDQEARDES